MLSLAKSCGFAYAVCNTIVIFLDIDGVLQPCLSQKSFDHDLSETREMVARETGNSKYLQLDKYDVGAVYYDWSEKAVYYPVELTSMLQRKRGRK